MNIKDKSILYGRTIAHLSIYVNGKVKAEKQGAKAKKLAKEHKRSTKYTDGLESPSDDVMGILATEDCSMLYDLGLISSMPDSFTMDFLNKLRKKYRRLFVSEN